MKSDLQIVADALRKHGFGEVATEIESSEIIRDIVEAENERLAMDSISDTYGG